MYASFLVYKTLIFLHKPYFPCFLPLPPILEKVIRINGTGYRFPCLAHGHPYVTNVLRGVHLFINLLYLITADYSVRLAYETPIQVNCPLSSELQAHFTYTYALQ